MVAKIKSGKSLVGALNYNENKVGVGKAELIGASGYAKDQDELSFHDKLFRLKDLAARNRRTRTNTVHLSLNFDVTEKLNTDKLVNIANEYMKRIGFESQPFLVYQHFDAGHPHIHILSTNIAADGQRISLHNIGELKSEPARKAIELEFGLVQANSKNTGYEQIENLKISPLDYGSTDTKRAVTNIVNEVARFYQFTSLPELNAILNLYNITADRGSKESVMFSKGGLHYWVIDKNGKKTGVPIKASSIYSKPTLKLLGDRFKLNEFLKKPYKDKLKARIDKVIFQATSLAQFRNELKKVDISVIVRENAEGRIYGISYIDQLNKVIFNGSDLGKNYSAAAVINTLKYKTNGNENTSTDQSSEKNGMIKAVSNLAMRNDHSRTLLDDLVSPYDPNANLPGQFEPKKKKKKRKNLNL